MNISADGDWRVDSGEIRLLHKDFFGLIAEEFDGGLLYELIIFDFGENVVDCF